MAVSKIYPLNLFSKNKIKFKCDLGKEKFLKFKTNLLALHGEKISFQTHASFFIQFGKNLDKAMTTSVSLLNDSRKKSYIDLKLVVNCLRKILKNNSNKNLYFKETYE